MWVDCVCTDVGCVGVLPQQKVLCSLGLVHCSLLLAGNYSIISYSQNQPLWYSCMGLHACQLKLTGMPGVFSQSPGVVLGVSHCCRLWYSGC